MSASMSIVPFLDPDDPEALYWERCGYLLRELAPERQRLILLTLSAHLRDLPEAQPIIEDMIEKLTREDDELVALYQAEEGAS